MEVSSAGGASPPLEEDNPGDVFDEDKLKEILSDGTLEFDDWTWLISEIESSFPDDIEKLCLVYDAFLSEFPLCPGYWRKYAYHKMRLCTIEMVVEVFERAVQAATYSVAAWVDYCSFGVAVFEDPKDVRRLFERALSFVGKDYLCHSLWDKYIEFLSVQEHWSSLAHIYLRTLRFPSKKLHLYYESFRKLAASLKEEIEYRIDVNGGDLFSEATVEGKVPSRYTDDEILNVVKDLLAPSTGLGVSKALQAYLSIGEQFYQDAHRLMEKIHSFETQIRRPYFHVKPLDTSQLDNWHEYLNFAETYGDFDWAIKLYERCLIPCANCPEFWIRYVDFVESKGGRELANFALARATQIFLKNVDVIHLFSARFKEQIGDVSSACVALSQCGKESGSSFVENVTKKANMEKRLGDFEAAANTFQEALDTISAGKENMEALPMLYVNFSRLNYVMTNSANAARKILIDGIEKVPHCKLLLEELIRFVMMHGGSQEVDLLDSIIAKEISSGSDSLHGLSAEDKEDVSNLYMEFIDLCGTINDMRKAWKRHIRLFPHSVRVKSYAIQAMSEKPVKGFMQRRQKTLVRSTQELSTENGIDLTVTPRKEKKELPPDSDANQLNNVVTGHLNGEPNSGSLASGLEARKENAAQKENHGESQEDLKGLSLERLSSSSRDDEDERPRKISVSTQGIPTDGPVTKPAHFLINPAGARESDAIEIQPSGSQSPSSSPLYQRGISVEPLQEQESVRQSCRSWHRRSNANRDPKPGSRERPLQRQIQSYSPAETGSGILGPHPGVVPLGSQAQPRSPTFASYADQATLQASTVQNLQNQSPASASQPQLPFQPAVAYPQLRVDSVASQPENTVQSNDQEAQMRNNEAYNQMWQHYYYYYYYYNNQMWPQLNQNSQQQPNQNSPLLLPEQYQQQLLQLHQYFQQQASEHFQKPQAESQHLPSQQLEQLNKLQSPTQQSQEQQNQQQLQFQQQQQWFLQQQQQWFPQQQHYWHTQMQPQQQQQPPQPQPQLTAQQPYPQQQQQPQPQLPQPLPQLQLTAQQPYPQQQPQPQQPQPQLMSQQPYPQLQSSYEQQQQYLLYLHYQQHQQYQQQQPQPQGEEKREEQKFSVSHIPTSDGNNRECQECGVAATVVASGGNASAPSPRPPQSPGSL